MELMSPKLLAETAGMIGLKELKEAFREVSSAQPVRTRALWRLTVDVVGDGLVTLRSGVRRSWRGFDSFPDFLPFSRCLQFDIDGDGSITSEELRHAMVKLLGEKASKTEIDAVVREADNNGDGTVDFEGETQRCSNAPLRPHRVAAALFSAAVLGCVPV